MDRIEAGAAWGCCLEQLSTADSLTSTRTSPHLQTQMGQVLDRLPAPVAQALCQSALPQPAALRRLMAPGPWRQFDGIGRATAALARFTCSRLVDDEGCLPRRPFPGGQLPGADWRSAGPTVDELAAPLGRPRASLPPPWPAAPGPDVEPDAQPARRGHRRVGRRVDCAGRRRPRVPRRRQPARWSPWPLKDLHRARQAAMAPRHLPTPSAKLEQPQPSGSFGNVPAPPSDRRRDDLEQEDVDQMTSAESGSHRRDMGPPRTGLWHKKLHQYKGQQLRFRGTVDEFYNKLDASSGRYNKYVVLRNVVLADSDKLVAKCLWKPAGQWTDGFEEGNHVEFEALVRERGSERDAFYLEPVVLEDSANHADSQPPSVTSSTTDEKRSRIYAAVWARLEPSAQAPARMVLYSVIVCRGLVVSYFAWLAAQQLLRAAVLVLASAFLLIAALTLPSLAGPRPSGDDDSEVMVLLAAVVWFMIVLQYGIQEKFSAMQFVFVPIVVAIYVCARFAIAAGAVSVGAYVAYALGAVTFFSHNACGLEYATMFRSLLKRSEGM